MAREVSPGPAETGLVTKEKLMKGLRRFALLLLLPGLLMSMALVQGCRFGTEPEVSFNPSPVQGPTKPPVTPADGMSTSDSLAFLEIPVLPQGRSVEEAEPATPGFSTLASRILSVKFAPQVPPGDWAKTMSCGPASLNLGCAYIWGATPDQVTYIRAINKYLGKTDIDNCLPGGTSTSDLERAGRAVNGCPNTYRASGWTLARLRQELDAGRPVVVAVKAGYLPNRGYSYTGGHFVLVVGYNDSSIIAHDVGTSGGAYKYYSNSAFGSAMGYFGGAVVVPRR
jgi:hypothetical protein